eukprot:gene8418-9319_t
MDLQSDCSSCSADSFSSLDTSDYEEQVDEDVHLDAVRDPCLEHLHKENNTDAFGNELLPYQDEPLADEEWVNEYRERKNRVVEQDARMERRLHRQEYEQERNW